MWLLRILGLRKHKTPPHVQEALDTVAAANEATDKAKAAVSLYWGARQAEAIVKGPAEKGRHE